MYIQIWRYWKLNIPNWHEGVRQNVVSKADMESDRANQQGYKDGVS